MTFNLADELLNRQMAGELSSPVTRQLGMRLVCFARGVAVYEMPLRRHSCDPLGRVENGVLAALAEAAMTAAARAAVADGDLAPDAVATRGLTAEFVRPATMHAGDVLRAEAIVMRRLGPAMQVEAEVLCGDDRIATFAATCSVPLPAQAPA